MSSRCRDEAYRSMKATWRQRLRPT